MRKHLLLSAFIALILWCTSCHSPVSLSGWQENSLVVLEGIEKVQQSGMEYFCTAAADCSVLSAACDALSSATEGLYSYTCGLEAWAQRSQNARKQAELLRESFVEMGTLLSSSGSAGAGFLMLAELGRIATGELSARRARKKIREAVETNHENLHQIGELMTNLLSDLSSWLTIRTDQIALQQLKEFQPYHGFLASQRKQEQHLLLQLSLIAEYKTLRDKKERELIREQLEALTAADICLPGQIDDLESHWSRNLKNLRTRIGYYTEAEKEYRDASGLLLRRERLFRELLGQLQEAIHEWMETEEQVWHSLKQDVEPDVTELYRITRRLNELMDKMDSP